MPEARQRVSRKRWKDIVYLLLAAKAILLNLHSTILVHAAYLGELHCHSGVYCTIHQQQRGVNYAAHC